MRICLKKQMQALPCHRRRVAEVEHHRPKVAISLHAMHGSSGYTFPQ